MTTTDATYRKEIRYDRETRDYAMYLDGELVGYERTYSQAKVELDELVYNLLTSGMHRTASELDGGSDADVMAEEVAAAVTDTPLGECAICGCAAWTMSASDGLLCPDHAGVLAEAEVTGDFAAHLNGELIGYFGNYSDAENALDQVAYDQLMDGVALTAAELDGGSDADTMAEEVAAAVVAHNPGIHVNQYTVTLSQPDQAFSYELRALCDECRAKTSGASKMGEIINGYCDGCGVGPSVSHFRLEPAPVAVPETLTVDQAQTLCNTFMARQRAA